MPDPNPLLPLVTEHRALPFDRVQPDQIEPAIAAALESARSAIRAIVENPDPPTFENTVLALESADEGLDRIRTVFYHLLHVQSNQDLQTLAGILPPKFSAFHNDILLNQDLFKRLETVESSEESLSVEQQRVVDEVLAMFRRNGASLSATDQETLRKLDQDLSTCAPAFAEHVLKATQAYSLWIADPEVIRELPESARATAKQSAKAEGRGEEWKFTLDAPSYLAFMTYSTSRELREEMWRAYSSRCVEGEFDNTQLIRTIVTLRHQRAQLLGYPHHAAYTLERRMVGSLENLNAFYNRMIPVVMPSARQELETLHSCRKQDTGEPEFKPWDVAYYSEKLRQQEFDFRQEDLRPWFEFDATLEMIFDLIGRLFDLGFEPDSTLPVYRENLRTYRVFDQTNGSEMAQLLIDPFPSPSKRPGAWMNALLGQGMWAGTVRRPVVGIVGNFTPPSDQHPSLLTMGEARTLFHEFGHALHEILSECTYRSVAGTHVRWDFVELPSQLLENWLLEPEFLRNYPRHYQTGERIPDELVEKIQASKTFLKGIQSARQIAFGRLDLAWYTTPPEEMGDDLFAFEQNAVSEVSLFPPQPGIAQSPSFQHIFSGGYSSGYYSYKWAEVLEADVFEAFQEKGLFDRETASRLKSEILSKGGSRPPEVLFEAFRGRPPNPDALLKRDGLM